MHEYLAYGYDGPGFQLFSVGHPLAISTVAGAVAFLLAAELIALLLFMLLYLPFARASRRE